MGDELFQPYFDQVITEILKTCNEENELQATETEKKPGFSLDTDSEDDGEAAMHLDVATLDEKSSAINALGVMGMNVPNLMHGKLEEIMSALELR